MSWPVADCTDLKKLAKYLWEEIQASESNAIAATHHPFGDDVWLRLINQKRNEHGLNELPYEFFKFAMDALANEWFIQNNGVDNDGQEILTHYCSICGNSKGEEKQGYDLVFCKNCKTAVHRKCYGVSQCPKDPWLCARCIRSPTIVPPCLFCPNKQANMAFKQTTTGKWVHLICALYIPETCIVNEMKMEPIHNIHLVPKTRWGLVYLSCYTIL